MNFLFSSWHIYLQSKAIFMSRLKFRQKGKKTICTFLFDVQKIMGDVDCFLPVTHISLSLSCSPLLFLYLISFISVSLSFFIPNNSFFSTQSFCLLHSSFNQKLFFILSSSLSQGCPFLSTPWIGVLIRWGWLPPTQMRSL